MKLDLKLSRLYRKALVGRGALTHHIKIHFSEIWTRPFSLLGCVGECVHLHFGIMINNTVIIPFSKNQESCRWFVLSFGKAHTWSNNKIFSSLSHSFWLKNKPFSYNTKWISRIYKSFSYEQWKISNESYFPFSHGFKEAQRQVFNSVLLMIQNLMAYILT